MRDQARTILQMVLRPIRRIFNRHLAPPAAIHANPYLSGKLYPVAGDSSEYIQLHPEMSASGHANPLPVPPLDLWEGYAANPDEYLACGRLDMSIMMDALTKAGASPAELRVVLDFGCAAGRLLRFYPNEGKDAQLWGVDISAPHINWCQLNLGPRYSFMTTTTEPHLPFADGHFDLVYCASVFTHISDLADAWFLELRRIVRQGGYMYITIHDQRSMELLLTRYRHNPLFADFVDSMQSFCDRTGVRSQNYAFFSVLADPISQVFYDRDYLVKKWGRWAEVLSVIPEGHDHQTTLIFRK